MDGREWKRRGKEGSEEGRGGKDGPVKSVKPRASNVARPAPVIILHV